MSSYKLKDLITIHNGTKYSHLENGNTPLYGSGGLMGYVNNHLFDGEAILLPRKGTLTNIMYVNEKFWSVDTMYYATTKDNIDTYYLYAYLSLLNLECLDSGSALPSMTKSAYNEIKINLPSFNIQKKIGSFLKKIDSKIELNNRINAELEKMAKTLYDYWFVQFDFPCLPENYSYARFAKAGEFSEASKPENFESVLTYSQVGGLPLPDGKKWFVYIIECVDGTFYKGMTNDLYRRYYEHKTGQGAEWTKIHKPKKVIHYEEFDTQQEAAKREKELKTGYGRTWLKREYEKYLKGGNGLPALKDGNGLPALKDGNGSPALKDGNGSPAPECKLRTAGKMVYNKKLKREIPEKWEVERLDQVESNIVTGKTPSTKITEYFGGNLPFICIGDVRGDMHIVKSQLTLSKKGAETQKNKYIPAGSICVTCIASPGLIGFTTELSQTNQQLNSIVCERNENKYYLYFYLQDYFRFAKAKTGNTFANMNKEDFSSILVLKPNDDLLINFFNVVESSINKILINTKENQKLTELRDWLLPMLMNGQVEVI